MDGDTTQDTTKKAEMSRSDREQIGTMEAWSLLQGIEENLNNIDDEINNMNKSHDEQRQSRDRQLRNIKTKKSYNMSLILHLFSISFYTFVMYTENKKKRTKAELSNNLQQQTDLLNAIYNNL